MTRDFWASSFLVRLLSVVAFLVIGPLSVLASDSLPLSGTVSDPSGAVVPGATVSIQRVATSDTKTTQTDDKGVFEFLLPPGKYRIDIAAAGFGPYEQDDVEIDPTLPLRLDVLLRLEAHQ